MCVGVCTYKKNERSVDSHSMNEELNEDAPWWRALTKWFLAPNDTEKREPSSFLFIVYVYAHPLRHSRERTRTRAYT